MHKMQLVVSASDVELKIRILNLESSILILIS